MEDFFEVCGELLPGKTGSPENSDESNSDESLESGATKGSFELLGTTENQLGHGGQTSKREFLERRQAQDEHPKMGERGTGCQDLRARGRKDSAHQN